jgi:type III secretion system chaperone SycN
MNSWETAIRQLGEQLGLPQLRLGANGRVAFPVEGGRHIGAEILGEGLLVYASDPVPYDSAQRLMRAWSRSYMTRLAGPPLQTVLREQGDELRILAVARLPPAQCSTRDVHAAIRRVSEWLDNTRQP